MIEALACGTPVVATPCGAAPELIEHDTTGYLAGTPSDLARAIDTVHRLDRHQCRRHAIERFSMDRMAHNHERLYEAVLAGRVHLTTAPTA
jgi:glycosyltransferase involved in cell wall biosynthesis